jgi:sarcosine oxidase subunit beta
MLMDSLRFFTSFKEQYGEDLGVHRTGYLLLNESDQSDYLDQVIEKAREAGCQAHQVSAADAFELQPGLRENSGDIYASEPAAIHVDPMAAVQALARVARRLGVEIVEGCEVHSILKSGSHIHGVETHQEKIEAGNVPVATAVWGGPQLAKLGIEAPVYPHPAEMAFLRWGLNRLGGWCGFCQTHGPCFTYGRRALIRCLWVGGKGTTCRARRTLSLLIRTITGKVPIT